MELTWSVFKHPAADVKEDVNANVATFAASRGEKLSIRIDRTVVNPLNVFSLLFLIGLAWEATPSMRSLLEFVFIVTAATILVGLFAERAGKFNVCITPTDSP